ncbi:hypothetical protein WJX72_005319 [[Myrmecia] bisecta]|uniref:CreA protein n=1 Tax=[Myrmecia] bisecta TaxID=41462 RepID=A0AAW1Q947_9CHLO
MKALLGLAASSILISGTAHASDKIGEFTANGLIFKDSVEAVAIDDQEVQGVTIYVSDFKRSLADKLSKDFFAEPSQASVTCAATGPVSIRDVDAIRGSDGHEVFSERKGLNLFQNKTLRVRRLYDEKRNTLLYVAYSTRLTSESDSSKASNSRYRTSICALPIAPEVSRAAASAQAQTDRVPVAAY